MTTGQKVIIGILIIVIIGLVVFGILQATAPDVIKSMGAPSGGTGNGGGNNSGGSGNTNTGGNAPNQNTSLVSDADLLALCQKFNYAFNVAWTSSGRCGVIVEVNSLNNNDLIRFRNMYIVKYGASPQSILEDSWVACAFSNEDDLLIDRFISLQTA